VEAYKTVNGALYESEMKRCNEKLKSNSKYSENYPIPTMNPI
jgi:hypothetical protein